MNRKLKRVISMLVAVSMILTVMGSMIAFAGDYENHWSKTYVEYLIEKGYISADADGNINPDGAMPRGAMVRLVNKIMGYTEKAEANFPDVSADNQYYEDFLAAKQAGYITGDDKGNANPDGTIIRGEIAVILARLYKFDTSSYLGKYPESDVPLWAMGAVEALDSAGIMKGNADGTFAGYKEMSNAEGYTIVTRMAKKQNGEGQIVTTAPPKVVHNPPAVAEPTRTINISVYDEDVAFDLMPTYENGKIWVSIQPVVELMQFDFIPTQANGFIVKNEWSYAEMTMGSASANLNNEAITIAAPKKNDIRYWMSLDDIMAITNSTYTWDADAATAKIQSPKLPEARVGTDSDIKITPKYRTATYEIPCSDPDAEITVWTLSKTTGGGGWRLGPKKWWKEYAPVYMTEKQAYIGVLTYLDEAEDRDNKVRVRIRSNGKEDIFEKDYRTEDGRERTAEQLMYDAKELTLIPTFNNIGIYINDPANVSAETYNSVQYRKKGDSDWKYAFRLDYDSSLKQYKGSIVQVEENTTYEVKVTIKDMTSKVLYEGTAETTTWTTDVPVAKTIDIKNVYTPGENVVIQHMYGSEDGWIKIKGDGKTVIDVTDEFWEAILVTDSKYIIFENLTIVGGYRHGIHVANNAEYIRIVNCDISGFGRAGTLNESRGLYVDHNGEAINNEAGVYIDDVSNIVVERCYIHDPKGRSNAWSGKTWKSVHPAGPSAMYGRSGQRIIVRYNDFVGSDTHRWNDSFETFHNFSRWGGLAKDCDIYGNYQVFGQDDSTELDGSQMNMRYYGNKVEGFLCGVSTACTTVGPSYLFRNLIINGGDEIGKKGGAVKNGQTKPEYTNGFSHHFHNTYAWGGTGIAQTSGYYLTYARNNILETTSATGGAAQNTFNDDGISFDYDLHYGKVSGPAGSEFNGVSGQATFVDKLAADYRLVEGSLGIDKGQLVPNFSEGYTGSAPDMGANEYGTDTMFPIRPVKIRSDKYQVNLVDTSSETVTFKIGDVPAGTTYKIVKNNVCTWFDVQGATEGTLTPNSTLSVTVKGVPSGVTFKRPKTEELKAMEISGLPSDLNQRLGNGAFMLRLSNGDSVPVTVYLKSAA